MLIRIAVNACAWVLIQLGLVFIANLIPRDWFSLCVHDWERSGRVYSWSGVRAWKDKLPDAGSWSTRGFSKRHLRCHSLAELERFGREASRGELVHWCAIGFLPLFALWNNQSGMLINTLYAIAANLPCIIVQRFNRARIAGLLRSRPTKLPKIAWSQRRWKATEP